MGSLDLYFPDNPDLMSFLGFFYVLIIAGVLTGIGVKLAGVINENFKTGQRLREALAERVKLLRLARMLKKRGLDVTAYLHEAPIHEIEANLRTCEGCDKSTECDNVLANPSTNRDLSFCPNDSALNQIKIGINKNN